MSFTDSRFIVFFAAVFAAYFLCPKKQRYLVLAAAGIVFYGFRGIGCLLVLLLVNAVVYIGGRCIQKRKSHGSFLAFFWLTLSVLIFFKAGNYARPGILPVGLSFYVFQAAAYLRDVWKGNLEAEGNPLRLLAYTGFFPTVLSGPIQKGRILLPQIREPEAPDGRRMIHGISLFVWGAFEKVCVSDVLSPAVAYIFDQAPYFTGIYYLTAAILFAVQLYADFSGYSDMAEGIAAMLGYDIPKNFNNPFLSVSMAELWGRWHCSLNDWFIENVYIPLGGSRKGKARKYLNVMAVFAVSGLWHGQGLHMFLWGILGGALMICGQATDSARKRARRALHIREDAILLIWIRRILVFLLFSLLFVFFRAADTGTAVLMIRGIFSIRPSEFSGYYPQQLFGKNNADTIAAMVLVLIFAFVQYERRTDREGRLRSRFAAWAGRLPLPIRCLALSAALSLCIILLSGSQVQNASFLYFAF